MLCLCPKQCLKCQDNHRIKNTPECDDVTDYMDLALQTTYGYTEATLPLGVIHLKFGFCKQ